MSPVHGCEQHGARESDDAKHEEKRSSHVRTSPPRPAISSIAGKVPRPKAAITPMPGKTSVVAAA